MTVGSRFTPAALLVMVILFAPSAIAAPQAAKAEEAVKHGDVRKHGRG